MKTTTARSQQTAVIDNLLYISEAFASFNAPTLVYIGCTLKRSWVWSTLRSEPRGVVCAQPRGGPPQGRGGP